MQCPKCSYEPTLAEVQDSPGKCPKCGSTLGPQDSWLGAKVSVEQLRNHEHKDRRRASERPLPRDASAVVVVGVDIPFMAMAELLIKLVFAAIPAAAILFLVFWLLSAVFAGR